MAKVTSKLQVTIPKRIADDHGIAPGDRIEFESIGDAIRIVPARTRSMNELSVEERLRLFDASSRRLKARAAELDVSPPRSTERDWQRADLYTRGTPR